jgi:hypothetical protein
MKVTTLKALVHFGLAALAFAELFSAKTDARKALLGAACGWHLNATFYHACLEKDEE